MAGKLRIQGLSKQDIQHPYDQAGEKALSLVKGLDLLVKAFSEHHYEKVLYIQNLGNCLRLNSHQGGKVYRVLRDACRALDVALPGPELYLWQYPVVNAWTYGTERKFIVITSAMIDLMDDDELTAVFAHELGHVICGHTKYRMMGEFLIRVANVGLPGFVTEGLTLAFQEWERQAEFSADRAALLATQDPTLVSRTLMKLAGGSIIKRDDFRVDEFVNQAQEYLDISKGALGGVYKFFLSRGLDHPFPAVRAKEILDWSISTDYTRLLTKGIA